MENGFLQIFLMIFLAEMGDKSQFLMVAMSTEYRLREILIGSGMAILTLNALAILIGSAAGGFLPQNAISLIAGIAFCLFGIDGFLGHNEKEEKTLSHGKSAVISVFGTYFLAELGDKTQLTALTLSAGCGSTITVFLAASSALYLSGICALILGAILGKRLPVSVCAALSGLLFSACGIIRLLEGYGGILQSTSKAIGMTVVTVALFWSLRIFIYLWRKGKSKQNDAKEEQSFFVFKYQ